ncbi:hypothetical protein [Euzebya sp.]|uniref:hypothetical protein n=1 Tax=Euzebya sp. TaxID=1971409 RepID=UPI003513C415
MDDHLHGATTTDRLNAAGIGHHAIRARIEREELLRVQRRLFVHAAARATVEQRAAIGLLAVKGRGVVTGATVLTWRGLNPPRRAVIDITVPEGSWVTEVDGVDFRRSSHLDRMSVTSHEDLPCAPLDWAIGDACRDLTDRQVARVVCAAIGAGLTTLQRLAAHLLLRPRFTGSARLRRVLAQLEDDVSFSGTEAAVARVLRANGYPALLNHPVPEDDPVRLGDIVLLDDRFNLEVDGPSHWLPEKAARDRRDDAALRDRGITVERITVYDVDADPGAAVALTRSALARSRRRAS